MVQTNIHNENENTLNSNLRTTRSKTNAITQANSNQSNNTAKQTKPVTITTQSSRAALNDLSNQPSQPALTKSKTNISKNASSKSLNPSKPSTSNANINSTTSTSTTTNNDHNTNNNNDNSNSSNTVIITKDAIPKSTSINSEQLSHTETKLPMKRAATASATNLVEKIHQQDYKKTKIDYVWEDLDEEDIDDPLMASEFVVEIFQYFHELEKKTLPDAEYLTWQKYLKPKMRSILVDWIVEVHGKFKLLPETLFLAINIMDRFMSKEIVQVDKLQLLATGSLFIAAKYEEIYSPSVKNYAYVTDGGYNEQEILQAEKYILQILNFDLSYPNPMNFLRRISKADDYDVQSRTISKYLLEISIMDHKFIGILPSLCAAAAMYVARKILGKSKWNGNLIHYSGGYKEDELKSVCQLIIDYLVAPIIHEEFFKKYALKKFMKASILTRTWAKRLVANDKNIMDNDI